jgi:hypothetical protein
LIAQRKNARRLQNSSNVVEQRKSISINQVSLIVWLLTVIGRSLQDTILAPQFYSIIKCIEVAPVT